MDEGLNPMSSLKIDFEDSRTQNTIFVKERIDF